MITSKTVNYRSSDDWISKLIGKLDSAEYEPFYKRFPHIKDRVFKKV